MNADPKHLRTDEEDLHPSEEEDALLDQPVGSVPDPYQGEDYDSSHQDPEASDGGDEA